MPYALSVAWTDAISTELAFSKAMSASFTKSVALVAACIISIIAVKGTAGNRSYSSRGWEMQTR